MERWLSLTVSEAKWSAGRAKKPLFLISIPKKIVNQAVRRNRIKRVLREALRDRQTFEKSKVYVFKVFRSPEKVNLENIRLIIDELLK